MPFHQNPAASLEIALCSTPEGAVPPVCPWLWGPAIAVALACSSGGAIKRTIRAESCSNPLPLMLHPNANTPTATLLSLERDNAICTMCVYQPFRPADSIIPGVNKTPDMNQCCSRIQTKPRAMLSHAGHSQTSTKKISHLAP